MADSVANASTEARATPVTSRMAPMEGNTRLLKEVEEQENRYIYNSLYKSLEDTTDEQIRGDLGSSDTLQASRAATRQFYDAAGLPLTEKAKRCGVLISQLSQKHNRRVASVFVMVSVLMMTLPVFLLFVGMKIVSPRTGWDSILCGGFLSVGGAVAIMMAYTVYAAVEEIRYNDAVKTKEKDSKKD